MVGAATTPPPEAGSAGGASGSIRPAATVSTPALRRLFPRGCAVSQPLRHEMSGKFHTFAGLKRTMDKPQKILVAMSGGIDSSAVCLQLLDAGYEVVGMTMRV